MKKLWSRMGCVFLLSGFLRASDLTIPIESLPQDTPDEKKLAAKVGSGDFESAVKDAQGLVKKSPDTLGAWMLIGAMAAQNGEFDQALVALANGLKNKVTDVPFLLLMARIHEDRADLGPGGMRTGGMVRYQARDLKIDREAFRKEQFRQAAECFQRAIVLRPAVALYQAKHASLLIAMNDFEGAEKVTGGYLEESPENALLLLQSAKASVKLEHWEQARAAAAHCIALTPAESEAFRVLGTVAAHEGREEEKQEWERKTRFYGYMPQFLLVPYSEKYAAEVEAVGRESQPAGETKEQGRLRYENAKSVINRLIEEKSDDSGRLLAAIAWHHEWHGEVENRIFQELESRGNEAVIMALFDNARSFCTVGGCAPALARLKSETAFPLILERLPSDRNPFSMGLPEALAIYHRKEAVPVLGQTVYAILAESRRAPAPGDFMAFIGNQMLVSRCLWALSSFDGPEARGYLEAAARKKEWGSEATAALFVQSKDKRNFTALMKLLKRDPAEAKSIAARFKDYGLPEAEAVQALVPPEKDSKKTKT